VVTRPSFGSRTFEAIEVLLSHLRRLPRPESPNRFCWGGQNFNTPTGRAKLSDHGTGIARGQEAIVVLKWVSGKLPSYPTGIGFERAPAVEACEGCGALQIGVGGALHGLHI